MDGRLICPLCEGSKPATELYCEACRRALENEVCRAVRERTREEEG